MFLKFYLVITIFKASSFIINNPIQLNFTYHNYDELKNYLMEINAKYPDKTYLYSIGTTKENRAILVLAISLIKPSRLEFQKYKNVKLIGNIHGDEAVGRELLLHFIEYILTPSNEDGYKILNSFMKETIIHILPSLNPDGFEHALQVENHQWRGNSDPNVDLNRNFPDYFMENDVPRELETVAVMNWLREINFVFSISFHGGALVVSYPYDNKNPISQSNPSNENLSDDDDVFKHLSKSYVGVLQQDAIIGQCSREEYIEPGITNGAKWYPITGGMQDYNYFNGVFELTIELSCPKFPELTALLTYWNSHKDSIIRILDETRRGIRGRVLTINKLPVPYAEIYVKNRIHNVFTNNEGYFWRLLLPGSYVIKVNIPNVTTQFFPVQVPLNTGYVDVELVLNI